MSTVSVVAAHDLWAHGRRQAAMERIWNGPGCDFLEAGRLDVLRARFLLQCGRDDEARLFLNYLDHNHAASVRGELSSWINNTKGFLAYESSQEFDLATHHYRACLISLGGRLKSEEDMMLGISAYWRLSMLELAAGNRSCSDRLMSKAEGVAKDFGRGHMVGVTRFASGLRLLALGERKKSYDNFLNGLFQVDYDHRVAPTFLHAELMLGLLLVERRFSLHGRETTLLNRFTTLETVRAKLSFGRGRVVTPFVTFTEINPGTMLAQELSRTQNIHRRDRGKLKKAAIIARDMGMDRCVKCGSRGDLTVDHLIPAYWGGTEHSGNLRILCRRCNSIRKHHFTWADNDAFEQLKNVYLHK